MDSPLTPTARPLAGVLWMLLTGAQFIAVTALVKYVGAALPAPETAFLRYAMGLVFLIPIFPAMMRAGLDRKALGLFGLRGTLHAFGVMLWFYAMTQIPIAEVTSLGYINPVFVTIGAVVFLGERLAARRIAAVVVALIGALIILRPGVRELSPGHVAMLANAVVFSGSYLIAKIMADRVAPGVVVAWLSLVVTIVLAPFAIAVWVWPTWSQLGWLFLVAAFATGGHFTMTLAFRAAPLAVTQPVTFLQLVWSVLLGALVFSEPVDGWVLLGGTLVVGAVSFITWREAVLKRRAVTPPSVATKV
ncbi:DMT family transporter [Psychromarinibacter sp. C21-152]|uniref:DMT family transporter n=1 Tax=Psychromarinibacter sediminicola TaxID=3033385 RepID=A0AAE3T897_9RHOB|nr:DMT family transporter [Psychromarinibacter sediminicola]MDF0599859.1 DMT family transporter [Psychromarinibacter sediminicola]